MPVARPTKKELSSSATSLSDDDYAKESHTHNIKNTKRKRQSQSCDACRARKVRCARENPDDPKQSCKHCITLGIPCTYDYQPKKRGPPNLYLRRLQEAAAAAAAVNNTNGNNSNSDSQTEPEASASPVSTIASPTQSLLSPSIGSKSPPPAFLEPSLKPTVTTVPVPPSRYQIAADTFHPQYTPPNYISSPTFNAAHPSELITNGNLGLPGSKADEYHSPTEQFSTYPLYNWSYKQHQVPVHPPNVVPPLSFYYRPRRLDEIAPRDTISLIIALFFDFVYPLTPCVHRPLASTLVQVPRSYLPMERPVVRKLAQTCHEASRHITVASYDPPTSMHVVIRYFDCVYHFCEGHDATQHAAFGEAAHIAVTLRLHEEAAYEGIDPIECEVRRRVFWLLFGVLQPINRCRSYSADQYVLRDEDCTLHFPKELDDEYITPSAYLPQPHGKTAIVSGLNYASRIFALLGEILVRIRVDKRSPPQGQFATARLEEVQSLHSRILSALAHCPEPLRLKRSFSQSNVPPEYGGAGFRQATFAEVKDFFDNPNASRENALNPFLVIQGNIYVTQQLVRFVIEQYRDELVMSIQGSIDEQKASDKSESCYLLTFRLSIPIQSIATNGPSLVHKVRFVASTLLDAVRKAETAPASAARAHAYLWDFLSILSEIERNYLLDDDRDGTSSGDKRKWADSTVKYGMRNATILVVQLKGTATEVIKNIVLSGIGKLVIMDGEEVLEEDLGSGFFFRDEDVGKKVRHVSTLQKDRIESLNPLVTVETIATFSELEGPDFDATIQGVDLVCVTDWNREGLIRLNEACRRLGKPFYAGGTYGVLGYIFCDLLKHDYVAPNDRSVPKEAQKNVKLSATYPPLSEALRHRWTALTKRQTKEVNPAVVFAILALWEYQKVHGQLPTGSADVAELQSIANAMISAADVKKQVLETIPSELIQSLSETARSEFSPVCAIVGGMLAQDILKTLGARDPPIANFFTFDGNTGAGTVCRWSMP
ncbi:Quinate utilization pathway activator [Mycena venus]|uniref:Quinate utilization pathway activator n=1 Tax=Mycena venus TaxID=2733690 RepID=A0A8H7DAW9_9AGAR|nr:Quinate utilization pathway activator [Mycena venus]